MSNKLRIGVLASGRGSNLQALMAACAAGTLDGQVVTVLSDRQDAPALDKARAAGIPAEFWPAKGTREDYDRQLVQALGNYQVQLVALAGYMRLVTPVLLQAFPERVVNIHPSLLPAFPGLGAQRQALEYGVCYSGCTVHLVDAGLDSGPILDQAVVAVLADDTVESLAERILAQEHILYPRVLQRIAEGRLAVAGRRTRWD